MTLQAAARVRCDRTAAWAALQAHYDAAGRDFDVRDAFAADPQRFGRFSQEAPHVFADLSKNRIGADAEALLLQLARECGLEGRRDAMFAGEAINHTEQRAVMHWLLREPAPSVPPAGQDASGAVASGRRDVHATLQAMLDFAERVRSDDAITDIVNIGIGGSDLGPSMVTKALDDLCHPGKRLHFVSNVDGAELGGVLRTLRPESTLFLVASKTFTTAETMTNAHAARAWFLARGGSEEGLQRHFAALTTNVEAAAAFGIQTTFGFWDWVGGRYSLWSAIGLPIAIAAGADGFRGLLAGAHAMDEHFRTAPLERNLPVRLGLLDVWYRNFHGFATRSVAPYSHALRRLPAYLQQLEMESNGKGVDAEGETLPFATSPVVWGEPGTNGQHAFFQMIHQGPDILPVEFIVLREPGRDLPEQHPRLVANALAQAKALMQGKASDDGHRRFTGNRPSTFLVLDRLDPPSLGALIALYEHRVFVSGALWGINSFDQWGVELGKVLAKELEPRLASGGGEGLDGSTAGLLARLR
ncbi:glucose-6-phosphate isomerase [Paracidovorax cattleyae]|uniref:Glucose-6-phosphate isomerase n=1 Tax=Paracidovorax cattleyae TaxID=80868 RepID=A0A1H0SEH0_9BURK|nr:glucose-6-phosphate isomerase [Paracidovorax cattleyae]AVS73243.1 glucose-6-phosphate isomerase [Paracidovorax cattleyae]MBF9265196.1 glucose-6-phosphate isomerase [Paracidovorax cattleyae]SDP40110.1 glucose-6-phosphate isomerase [Paracidovorax cattleyae]